jgi:hypothetical protein
VHVVTNVMPTQSAQNCRNQLVVTIVVPAPTSAGWRWSAFNLENPHNLALTGAGWRRFSALGAGGPRFESGRPEFCFDP